MVKLQKFLFDTDFGTPRIAVSQTLPSDDDDLVRPEEPTPPPSFSEQELTLAREQAFEAGRAAGRAEAEAALSQMEGMALASCAHYLKVLSEAQQTANQTQSRDAIAVALAVLRKLQPELCRRFGLAEIEAVLHDSLSHLHQVARVTIKVHPELVEPVRGKCQAIAERAGFEGRLTVAADAETGLGDCRLDWGDGGALRDQERTWSEIDRAVQGVLGALDERIAAGTAAETV